MDAGIDAGVTTDIDGHDRPYGAAPDIGADEWTLCPFWIHSVSISGPAFGYTETIYAFTAVISPANATQPITYTWAPAPQTGQSTLMAAYTWNITGPQVITVTAENCGGVATATHTVLIIPSASQAVEASPDADSTLTDTTDLTTTIEIPAGAVDEPAVLVYTPLPTPTQPLTGNLLFAGRAFRLEVYQGGVLQPGFAFSQPIILTLSYAEDAVRGLDESSLRLYYWDGTAWADVADTCTPPSTYVRDLAHNRLSVAVCHLTDFALTGVQGRYQIYLPVVLKNYGQ